MISYENLCHMIEAWKHQQASVPYQTTSSFEEQPVEEANRYNSDFAAGQIDDQTNEDDYSASF